ASTSNILSAHSLNNSLLGYPKHTAYHSAGEIWFTSRPSSGDSWSDDIRISSGDGGNNYPAMDTWSDEHYVAWQHQSGTLVQIMFSKFTSGQWASPQVIDNWTNPSAVNTLPAISGVFDRFWGIGQLQSIMVTYVRSGLTWWKISYNRGLTWSTFGPFSLLASKFEGTNFFGVSYVSSVNGSGISLYLDQLYGDGTLYQHIGWVPGCLISLSGEYLETRESYVSDIRFSYQDRTHISWWQYEFGDNEHYYVAAQSCNVGAQWSSVSAWEVGAPTSSTIATAFDNTVLMWSEGNQLKKVTASNVTGTWGSVASAGTGQYPILEYGFPHSDPSYLSIAAGSPISNIVQSTLSLQKTSNSTVDEVKREYSRVVFAVDTSTLQTFSIKMTQPRLNGRDIPFSAVNDTLPGINSENFFEFLRTKAGIIGSNDDTLTFKLSVTSKRMKGRQLSIPLSIEGISNSGNIGTLFSANESLCDSVTLLHVRVIVKNLAGMELSLKPLGRSLKDLGRNWVFGVGHVFDIPKNKKAEEDVTADIAVPAEAGIINNYPNPFNPSTEIRYQLPGPSFVTLKIYDVLGREVKALVNEELAAGYYTARFDGSGLSSGIYFARVSVTPREGKWAGTPLLYTLRMLLTK
ncbi:MAG TPA: T9SS type A sorting domain-containing protein, partial [Candidatus Hodarchaeales archaeon]|nr:T9SS type A sorting domain-containing protein [Candidatus Hodarchaeales archaeon]